MNWFFSDPDAVVRLQAAAQSWTGTPFGKFAKVKGRAGGIDCVGYVEELYREAGFPREFNFPRAETDYAPVLHNTKVLDYLRGRSEDAQSAALADLFQEFPLAEKQFTEPPMPGDLLLCRNDTKRARELGEFLWHMPVMIGPRKFSSCVAGLGVAEGMILDPTYARHFHAHFRARSLTSA